jgi:hypothetical protein
MTPVQQETVRPLQTSPLPLLNPSGQPAGYSSAPTGDYSPWLAFEHTQRTFHVKPRCP